MTKPKLEKLIAKLKETGLPRKVPGTTNVYVNKVGEAFYWKGGQHVPAKLQENSDGYLRFYYYEEEDGPRKRMFIHRAVWSAWKGEIPDGYDVDHDDHDKTNNRLDNLKLLPKAVNRKRTTLKRRDYMPLIQIENIETGEVRTVQGIKYAAEIIGVSATTVSRCLQKRQKTAGGWYVFELSSGRS